MLEPPRESDRAANRLAVLARLDKASSLSQFHLLTGVPRDGFREVLADLVLSLESWRTRRAEGDRSLDAQDDPVLQSDLFAAKRLEKYGARGAPKTHPGGDSSLADLVRRALAHQKRIARLKQHRSVLRRWDSDFLDDFIACAYGLWLGLANRARTSRVAFLQLVLPSLLGQLGVRPSRGTAWSQDALEKRLARRRARANPRHLAYCLLSTDPRLMSYRSRLQIKNMAVLRKLRSKATREGNALRGIPV